jgi:hypothetical protein
MKHYQEQIPLYITCELELEERHELEKHLSVCSTCQAELKFWQELVSEINISNSQVLAPIGLDERVLQSIHTKPQLQTVLQRAWQLLGAQAYLVKREMWPTSAIIMALGVIVALLSNHVEAIYFVAPLVAAASLAMLYNPEYDPAYELALSTPTSPWKILLARLSVVSTYNLILAILASLAMLIIIPPNLLGMVIMGWLAPMAFLSALALLLSLWISTSNAIIISYGLWIAQYLQFSKLIMGWRFTSTWDTFLMAYRNFWQSPYLLLTLSLVLAGMALFSIQRSERMITSPTV